MFGTTLVVSRFGVDQFAPTAYIALRLAIASFCFVLMYTFRIGNRKWPQGKSLWGRGFLMGVFGTALPMTGIVSSLQYLSSGLVSILITVSPAITVLLAHFFLDDEPLSRRKSGGVLLALSGAILLTVLGETGLPNIEQGNLLGYGLVLGGMVSGSAATIYARKFMQTDNIIDVTGIRMFAGMAVVFPLSFLLGEFDLSAVNNQGLMALFFAAIVGTFLGFLLSFHNIQKFGATAAVMTSYVVPVVAGIIGLLFLGEQITWGMFSGILLIGIGVWIISARQSQTNTHAIH